MSNFANMEYRKTLPHYDIGYTHGGVQLELMQCLSFFGFFFFRI